MAFDLTTGVVTLLFTDMEGSTRLLHELGDGYGDALHEHRRCLRAVFAVHDGVEVATQGDAFFVPSAERPMRFAPAEDGQRALAKGPIRVLMGLHTGEPRLTEDGYVGIDVHKGAQHRRRRPRSKCSSPRRRTRSSTPVSATSARRVLLPASPLCCAFTQRGRSSRPERPN